MQSALCQGGRELAMYVSLNHRHVETVRWDFNAFRLFQFFYFMLLQCCAYGVVRFIHKNLWVRVMKRSRFCLSVFPLMQLWTVLSHQNYPFLNISYPSIQPSIFIHLTAVLVAADWGGYSRHPFPQLCLPAPCGGSWVFSQARWDI